MLSVQRITKINVWGWGGGGKRARWRCDIGPQNLEQHSARKQSEHWPLTHIKLEIICSPGQATLKERKMSGLSFTSGNKYGCPNDPKKLEAERKPNGGILILIT